jgi:predicted anti-sigma-YlaC factor YlaD
MKNCQEIARLVSESHDRRLSFMDRLHIRFHLAMCAMCRRFSTQIAFINRLTRRIGEDSAIGADNLEGGLSAEAKARMQATISRETG